jgi:hypothetical protein
MRIDWKTTLPAWVGMISLLLKTVGLVEIPENVQQAIVTVCLFFVGVFATSRSAKQ